MKLKYNLNLSSDIVEKDIKRIINQVYKLLPLREQGQDWHKPLETIIQQLVGLQRLFLDQQGQSFLILLSKLEGLNVLVYEDEFALYRRVIFECLSLLSEMKTNACIKES